MSTGTVTHCLAAVAEQKPSDGSSCGLGVVSHLNGRHASLPVDLQEVNGFECFLASLFVSLFDLWPRSVV